LGVANEDLGSVIVPKIAAIEGDLKSLKVASPHDPKPRRTSTITPMIIDIPLAKPRIAQHDILDKIQDNFGTKKNK